MIPMMFGFPIWDGRPYYMYHIIVCLYVWFGLVWFGLVWFGLVWFGLVWFGCLFAYYSNYSTVSHHLPATSLLLSP